MSHLGYGNPAGPLWFAGLEEGLGGERDTNLRWRLDHFQHPVDTLTNHLEACWINGKLPSTPTWRAMSKISRLLLERAPDWNDGTKAAAYSLRKLGTADGQTFLAELLPLPNKSMSEWSHYDRFPGGRSQYMRDVLPMRLELLRAFAQQHRPRVVVCYGKVFWPHFQRLFPASNYREYVSTGDKAPVTIVAGRWEDTVVLHTPFFAPYVFPERVMADLPRIIASSIGNSQA